MLQRSYAVEPIAAVACSPEGVYCAGGGLSGTIYVWEVPSGRLLRSWPAHYKASTRQHCSISSPTVCCSHISAGCGDGD